MTESGATRARWQGEEGRGGWGLGGKLLAAFAPRTRTTTPTLRIHGSTDPCTSFFSGKTRVTHFCKMPPSNPSNRIGTSLP